jgi:hypothetical protein
LHERHSLEVLAVRGVGCAACGDLRRCWLCACGLGPGSNTLNQLWPEQKKLEALWFWDFDKPKSGAPLQYGATNKP